MSDLLDRLPYARFLGLTTASEGQSLTVTMPFDVCKTLLNTQEANVLTKMRTSQITGLVRSGKIIYQLAGFRGFFQVMISF